MIIIQKSGSENIEAIRLIAEKTWPVAYAGILSAEQMHYMLDKMYSLQALKSQLKLGHKFLLALLEGETAGFASYEINIQNSRNAKLHKLYVLPQKQGLQVGRKLLMEVIKNAQKEQQDCILLNVNRNNKAIHFYKKFGFKISREENIDIGNNYFMNDYIMELKL